jgi:hypothetical protein
MTRWLAVGCCGAALTATTITGSVGAQDKPTIGVEKLMKNVEQHRGSIRVEGVVSATSAEHRSLTLIDLRELRECGVTTCAEFKLPVRWTGPMPAVQSIVRVEGEVQETGGKFVFVATSLEKSQLPEKAP